MTNRRKFLQLSGVLGAGLLTGLSAACTSPKLSQKYIDRNLIASNKFKRYPKLDISLDRIVKETVGLRPFRKTRIQGGKTGTWKQDNHSQLWTRWQRVVTFMGNG